MSINRTILVGNLGRSPGEPYQKNAAGPVVKAPTAQAPCEATLGGRPDYRPAAALHDLRGLLARIGGAHA